MTTETDICNLALSHIGAGSIASLFSEQTKLALECRKLYPRARNTVLRDHDWGFAQRRDALAVATGITPIGYEYAYSYPIGCAKAHKLFKEDKNAPPYEFIINAADNLTQKVILTDVPQAILIYTARITAPNMYDDEFIDALSYRLAADLAVPVTKKTQVAAAMGVLYGQLISSAKTTDSDEQVKDKNTYSELRNARL